MKARVEITSRKHACAFLVLAAVVGWSAAAEAQYPPVVQPNPHQMFAMFNFGPSIGIEPGGGTQFKIAQEFGYHLARGGSGPAIGGSLEEAFGNGFFRLQIGPKFWWDIQPAKGLGLYLSPTAKVGYMLASVSNGGGSGHFFNFQLGFEVKLVLGKRGILMFRPFTLDMGGGGGGGWTGFVAAYDLMFGGGVAF